MASGAGSTLHVRNSVVRGKGPTPLIERHPVQYTGCSKQDSGCSYVVSTGILLFDVDSNAIERHLNTFRDNDVNVLNAQ